MQKIKAARPIARHNTEEIAFKVASILREVREKGDAALREFTRRFDGVEIGAFRVPPEALAAALEKIDPRILADLEFAVGRIRAFAERQKQSLNAFEFEALPGVYLGQRLIPVSSCGAYIPGGRYPLPSSALMSVLPAKVAGVRRVVACSPPDRNGGIHPVTLAALAIAGADEVYCLGGAQAIAALAYGTETIRPVDIIVGPGNIYVTEAKRQVSGHVGIDFLAGPSEVLVIADDTADPDFIAADLLAQCEHDPQACGLLITTSETLAEKVLAAIEKMLPELPTAAVAREAWEDNGEIILVSSLKEAAALANQMAPEHLEVQVAEPENIVPELINYGSLFLGSWAAEVFGDYVSGPNHILPTLRASRFTGGVWVGTFLKVTTYQRLERHGVQALAGAAAGLAEVEGLSAHRQAAWLRLKSAGERK
ncbi:MAG: histidinol dehydrogenase [Clostridia bacterium]|nr:histidinol dehydrogenase [Clostridia bacterium]